MPRTQSKKPDETPVIPPFNPLLRFTVEEAAYFLRQSRATTYNDVRDGRLNVVREGGRTFVHGSEIVRRCAMGVQS